MNDAVKILCFLIDHPGWYFGLELVAHVGVKRSKVYLCLAVLEEAKLIERASEPNPVQGRIARPIYRRLIKRVWSHETTR